MTERKKSARPGAFFGDESEVFVSICNADAASAAVTLPTTPHSSYAENSIKCAVTKRDKHRPFS